MFHDYCVWTSELCALCFEMCMCVNTTMNNNNAYFVKQLGTFLEIWVVLKRTVLCIV